MTDDKFGFGGSANILEDLNDLVSDWTGCTDCSLCLKRNSQVWFQMRGVPEPGGIMLIGDSPSKEDDLEGEIFIGPAGAKLNRLIEESGVRDIFLTNTLLCLTPGNRYPKVSEQTPCWPRLQRTIEIMRPSVIITAGRFATHWLLEIYGDIRSMSVNVYQWELSGILKAKVLPIFHPSHLLRLKSASTDRIVIDRLALALELSR